MKYRVIVEVMLRPDTADPYGKALHGALRGLGFDGISSVRQGKVIDLEVECDPDKINEQATAMCQQLLANSTTEVFNFQVLSAENAKP